MLVPPPPPHFLPNCSHPLSTLKSGSAPASLTNISITSNNSLQKSVTIVCTQFHKTQKKSIVWEKTEHFYFIKKFFSIFRYRDIEEEKKKRAQALGNRPVDPFKEMAKEREREAKRLRDEMERLRREQEREKEKEERPQVWRRIDTERVTPDSINATKNFHRLLVSNYHRVSVNLIKKMGYISILL